ncbi:MAG: 2-oxoacid:acceptor oxidoreductase subunit alpha, partial [Candidatus Latescibacteria bacterium]|nr:2-oxoacid:acceptor oxidoreductase subunit alpha [bacterium]MBD3425528.1 2-oxoacid:acceptor oxidoreductase subunit alpha [Candidatus Latescibacterota bacterium]
MNSRTSDKSSDVSIVLAGSAGQGVQTVERLLTRIVKRSGYHVFATKEYMSRVRGGMNSTLIRISERPVNSFVDRIDIFVPLGEGALEHLAGRIGEKTVILGEKDIFEGELSSDSRAIDIPFTAIAEKIGDKVYSNTVAIGALAGALKIDLEEATGTLREYFSDKDEEVVERNIEALENGFSEAEGKGVAESGEFDLSADPE